CRCRRGRRGREREAQHEPPKEPVSLPECHLSTPPTHKTAGGAAFFPRGCALSYESVSEQEWDNDARLVARCRGGSDDAWRELVARFSRYVYAICMQGFRLQESDAEDVFQEVFARTYQHLERLRDDAAIRPWLAQLT